MKIKPSKAPNFVFLDYESPNSTAVPIGLLSSEELEQFIEDTVAAIRHKWGESYRYHRKQASEKFGSPEGEKT